ncbi:MAG: DUF2318 domain-containing protein [Methylobacteriaceae bacterium]|jgi:uncharacterized membrane protein|nr:DUF2318 domain-containing protein [Methylobacteriaceae bacterium]
MMVFSTEYPSRRSFLLMSAACLVLPALPAAAAGEAGEDLVIRVGDVTNKAKFHTVNVDGTEMGVIAVRASDGSVRTAFNTCQVCYASGRGYYKQMGNYLVCQNCGNRFRMDDVEVTRGGCNPVPITKEDKVVTEDTITIPYAFLQRSRELFANWK